MFYIGAILGAILGFCVAFYVLSFRLNVSRFLKLTKLHVAVKEYLYAATTEESLDGLTKIQDICEALEKEDILEYDDD